MALDHTGMMKNNSIKQFILLSIFYFCICITLVFPIAAFIIIAPVQATIYVGCEDGLVSISEAIEKAKENETIIVCGGIYKENVVIYKPLILKAMGNVTIEALDDSKEVVVIEANNVVFSGFSVKGGSCGVY